MGCLRGWYTCSTLRGFWSRIKPDSYSATPVYREVIFLPTIIHLAGGKEMQFNNTDGGSFAKILFNENLKNVRRKVEGIFFHVPYRNGIAIKRPHSAVRKGDFKLLKFQDDKSIQLYNLTSDLKEQFDLKKKIH